jgi:hypothetical protein
VVSVRCPFCRDDIVPVPVEPEGEAPTTQYDCPSCRRRLPPETVEEYVIAEDEAGSA